MVIILIGVSGSGKTTIGRALSVLKGYVAPELLEMRLKQRQGHFMSPKLLLSQLETLEEPTADEATIVRVQTETSPETIALYIHNKLEHF